MGNLKRRTAILISLLFASLVFGIITKYLDSVPYFGDVFTRLGIWVFIGTLIAAYSKTLIRAGIHTMIFFLGMLIGYYVYSALLFGVFSTSYILYWGVIALASPFLAAIVWFAKNNSRSAFILPAFPMGLMLSLAMGMGIFYVYLNYITELIMYCVLCIIFYKEPKQMILIIFLSVLLTLIIKQSPLSWYTAF